MSSEFTGEPLSPWDPGGTKDIAPWSPKVNPQNHPNLPKFFVAVKGDKTSDVFTSFEDAMYFIGEQDVNNPTGTIHCVNYENRVYPLVYGKTEKRDEITINGEQSETYG